MMIETTSETIEHNNDILEYKEKISIILLDMLRAGEITELEYNKLLYNNYNEDENH